MWENEYEDIDATDCHVTDINSDHSVQDEAKSTTTTTTTTTRRNRGKNQRKKQQPHTLDPLNQQVSDLMNIFENNGWFIPLPRSEKAKTWSSRNYGADKKRQRKNAERQLLLDRIEQLQHVLLEQHGIKA